MKRGLGGQVVSLGFRMSWEISIKIQIGWEGGNWGAEVLAALATQISHTVFAVHSCFR